MNKYCTRGALFFAIFIVAAVMISVCTKFQEAEGALLAKGSEASELVSRAKRMWSPGPPLDIRHFGPPPPPPPPKDDSSNQGGSAASAAKK
jgi:hypothetical protein